MTQKELKNRIRDLERELAGCTDAKRETFLTATIAVYKNRLAKSHLADGMSKKELKSRIRDLQKELATCTDAKRETFLIATINIYTGRLESLN